MVDAPPRINVSVSALKRGHCKVGKLIINRVLTQRGNRAKLSRESRQVLLRRQRGGNVSIDTDSHSDIV